MAGLVPAIHTFVVTHLKTWTPAKDMPAKDVDARDERGHDDSI